MQKRKLGKSSLEIAPLVFGGNVFGWTIDEPTSFKILDAFVDAGFDTIDTADIYSVWKEGNKGGESETIIGNWLKRSGKRDKVLIATKVGMEMTPEKKGLKKAYILREVEDSLKRLQTDYIDLYQSHQDDKDTPLDETLDAFNELVKQGKARFIGASNYSAERLADSLKVSEQKGYARYESLQPEYNLYAREGYESEAESLCAKEQVGVISYFSLARGFLSGKYRSEADLKQSERGEGVKTYLNERGFRILDALDKVSAELSSTPTRVALAWLIARPSVTAPIVSATNLNQLQDLIESTKLVLPPTAIQLLTHASDWKATVSQSQTRV